MIGSTTQKRSLASPVKSSIRVFVLAVSILAVVTPQLSAEITLGARLSDARASAGTLHSGSDNPAPQTQTDFLPAHLNNSAAVSGESGSGSGNCNSNSAIVVDNAMGTLQVMGDGGASSSAILTGANGSAAAKLIVLTFTLADDSYAYSLTGKLTAQQTIGDSGSAATAKLTENGATVFEVVVAGPPAVNLSETGTLTPGDYTLAIEVTAAAHGHDGGMPSFGNSSANFDFELTPAPTPTPSPTPTAVPTASPTSTPTPTPVPCSNDTWSDTNSDGAATGRGGHTAVWTGSEMIIWGGQGGPNDRLNTGFRYNPITDSWKEISTVNAPAGRYGHTAVWTGSEMIVWGGFASDPQGGKYNPTTDTWTLISTANAPDSRSGHTAIWTGSEMIIWGGFGNEYLNTGGKYNPATDSWVATNIANAPSTRNGHTAVWTGLEMIVWGGSNNTTFLTNSGGRYNPVTDSWSPTNATDAPLARSAHTAVWLNNEMVLWGGTNGGELDTGGRYSPDTDSWTATSTVNAPAARGYHTAVSTGDEMIVWGGGSIGTAIITGGRYNPTNDIWSATSSTDAPSGRTGHTAIWTGSQMIVWGGYQGDLFPTPTPGGFQLSAGSRADSFQPSLPNFLSSGGRYCAQSSVAQAMNLSTRLNIGPGNLESNLGIGGFIVMGTNPRRVMLRGIGPSLTGEGVSPLADPVLELHGPSGFSTITNNNWRDNQDNEIIGTGLAPTNDLESAIVATLNPGAYTAILSGLDHGTGVGLVEVYDLSQGSDSKLGNMSTRAYVRTGNDIVIAGFILGGGTSNDTIAIRGLGPSLTAVGVADALPDPTLELRDSNGTLLMVNDNWQDTPIEPQIVFFGLAPTDPLESAIVASLPPGAYTALLSGVNNGTGVGLVEVYDVGSP